MSHHLTLLLGGARSGKSALACALASQHPAQSITYVATATAADPEMSERIHRHQLERPAHWHLLEAPLALAEAIREASQPQTCLIVDCLTLWLSNLLHDAQGEPQPQESLEHHFQALEQALRSAPGRVILVAAGKAAWNMAKAARDCLGDRIEKGIVITKYDHVKGPLGTID